MKNVKLFFICLIPFLSQSCKTQRVIHTMQEFISLKLIDSGHYKYLYYNATLDSFVYEYNTGNYQRNGSFFKLFADSIDNEHFEVQTQQKKNNLENVLRVHLTTDIDGDYLDQYKIQIVDDYNKKIIFHNVNADTFFNKDRITNIKIIVNLADRFSKGMGTQLPAFTTITTRKIIIDSTTNELSIHIPVSFSTFFYKYQREIDLEYLRSASWRFKGREVPMKNEDF